MSTSKCLLLLLSTSFIFGCDVDLTDEELTTVEDETSEIIDTTTDDASEDSTSDSDVSDGSEVSGSLSSGLYLRQQDSEAFLSLTSGNSAEGLTITGDEFSQAILFSYDGLTSEYNGGEMSYQICFDTIGSEIGTAPKLTISYDFDGDGETDREETAGYFALDPVDNSWECWSSDDKAYSILGDDYQNFEGGSVTLSIWNALGDAGTTEVKVNAASNQSALYLPYGSSSDTEESGDDGSSSDDSTDDDSSPDDSTNDDSTGDNSTDDDSNNDDSTDDNSTDNDSTDDELTDGESTDDEDFWGDTDSYPEAENVLTYVFLNKTYGEYDDSEIFWSFNGETYSIEEQPTYDMEANSSGRVYFYVGQENGEYWDFIEHTITDNNWYGNTTRVDAWRLPIAIRLICGDGTDTELGEIPAVFQMDRDDWFEAYKDSVPDEFDHCADNGYPYSIIAPGKGDGGFDTGEEYQSYYDDYLAELGYSEATTNQVFACSGDIFGSNASLAAAVNRHVAHLDESEWEDTDNFYLDSPANYYAKFIHEWSYDNKAYGFAYDDAAEQAAYTACSDPQYLIVAIGY